MLDNYAQRIAEGIVLMAKAYHVLLDNIAVRPDRQGRGLGRALIAFADAEARRAGLGELRLYTHVKMIENIALYTWLGFTETGRSHESGYDRVFMKKQVSYSPK
jgi:GNAT superfamily N-acetyltransferase